jgi:hypothetical protein
MIKMAKTNRVPVSPTIQEKAKENKSVVSFPNSNLNGKILNQSPTIKYKAI